MLSPAADSTNSSSDLQVAMFNNQCTSYGEAVPDDPVDNVYAQSVFGLIYSIVWLLAVLGNATVIYVAVIKRVSFTVRTIFIISLACSDLSCAFISLPAIAINIFTHEWIYPMFTCYVIGVFQGSIIFLSSFTLTAITVDRYFLILHPHRSVITYTTARNSLFVFLGVGVLLASPMGVFMRVDEYFDLCGVYCFEQWPQSSEWLRNFYGVAVPALQFGLPLIISSFCYYEIGRRMAIRAKNRRQQEHLMPKSEQKQNEQHRRASRMMAAMVMSFVAAWLPFNTLNFIRDFQLHFFPTRLFNLLFAVSHLLAMTSLIWNPFIYGFFHESFRITITNFFRSSSKKLRSKSTSNIKLSTAQSPRPDEVTFVTFNPQRKC